MVNGGVWKTTDFGRVWTPIFDAEPSGSIGAIDVVDLESERDLRRIGRRTAAPRSRDRRRHVQIDGRGKDVDPSRPARCAADSAHRDRPDERRPALRRGARPPVRPERRARHLPVDRRRKEFPESAVQGRLHRRRGRRARAGRSEHGVRGALVASVRTVGERQLRRHDERTVQEHRWRQYVDAAHRTDCRAGGTGTRPHSDRGESERPQARSTWSRRRSNTGRTVSLRRRAASTGTSSRTDNRIAGKADDEGAITVNPKNADIIYEANTVAWKSVDAGKTWAAHRGAPGGDDYQRYWINPNNPDIHAPRFGSGRGDHRERRA